MRASLAGIWMLFVVCSFVDSYVRQPSIDAIHYAISLELTDASNFIAGTTKIQVRIRSESASDMWLDFEDMSIDRSLVGGVERPFSFHDGRPAFEFGRTYSRNEIVLIEVGYHGKPQLGLLSGENRYGGRVVFADNWPSNAHHWFPSIDHPSDKATVSLAVTAPAKYDIVANGRMEQAILLPDNRKRTEWTENRAIPTYCMVFGMAEFSIKNPKATATVPLAWYAYPQDAEVAARKFSRTALILAYFGNLIGPYPYEKLAQVESIIRMGGMENSSAIFYSEASFLGVPVSEDPVAHEIAHQWFGDSVTEADWDDLWLSEGFADDFEALFYEHSRGPEAMTLAMAQYAKSIMEYKPARSAPIVDPRQTDPRKKLNPLKYGKEHGFSLCCAGFWATKNFSRGFGSITGCMKAGIRPAVNSRRLWNRQAGLI